jgi:hypothetical protein
MSKYFLSCNGKEKMPNSRKKAHSVKCFNLVLISRFFLLFIALFGVFAYILVVNNASVKGFEISNLEKKIGELNVEKQKIASALEEKKSIVNLKEKMADLNMVAVSEIEYLNMNGPVAIAR